MGSKRSTKWYRKNENEVMDLLGLTPTKNSGSGWIEKSDGQNENVICELKSTDSDSYRIRKFDLDKLEYNANVSHKVPVFAIQFIESDELYLVLKPGDLKILADGLKTGRIEVAEGMVEVEDVGMKDVKAIKSSARSRESFHKEREKKYSRERRAY